MGVVYTQPNLIHVYAHFSFERIGKEIGRDEVYVAAVFYGQVSSRVFLLPPNSAKIYANDGTTQAKPTTEELEKLSAVLNLPASHLKDDLGAHYFPDRGG